MAKKLRELIGKNITSYLKIGRIVLITVKDKEVDLNKLGNIILREIKGVRSVYLRKRVKGEMRINDLELIAGESNTTTKFKENGVIFEVDIAKVYVNPSLATERKRVAEELNEGTTILDAFTGYGAIALNIAKVKNCYVVGCDLNIDGLIMGVNSSKLNKLRGFVDFVNYHSDYPPFREKGFDYVILDNPMNPLSYEKLVKIGKKLYIYLLLNNKQEKFVRKVNEYSKDMAIYLLDHIPTRLN